MGGKSKQSQRTKNNVRPSSSGRSAELLSNNLKLDSSFITTGSGKVLPALFPTLTSTHIDQGLSPEYAVCFKKLHKKDPITKVKALQELTELIKNGNVEEIVTTLPSWASCYQTLTVDIDRRVREAVQMCHGVLVCVCGRRLAPQLRRVLPAWLLAAADEHGPAQIAARTSLQNTFPDGKLSEAISFCKSEIFSLLIENITGNAEAMLSNKVEDAEERAMQASRIVCSSLQALQAVLLALPPTQLAWVAEALDKPLQNDTFWRFAQHDAHHVRCSWYTLVGEVWRVVPLPVDAPSRRMLRALLARPERGAARWSALLMVTKAHQDWHTWLDKKDLLVKRLLDVLESGGNGEARAVCSSSLGMLQELPASRRTHDFYRAYFDAIFTGLNNKNLLSSKSERQIWISNLAECLQYLSEQNDDFVIEVVTSVQRKWLENIFSIQDIQARNNLIRHSTTNMASLIKNWLKQSKDEDKKYDQIIRNIWLNIGSTVITQIDKLSMEQKDIMQLIETHTLMLKTFKTEYLEDTKPKRNIKFADEEIKEKPITVTVDLDVQLKERFKHNLDDVVEKTCCSYIDFAYKKQVSQVVFTSLITLIEEVKSKSLFLSIARHFDSETIYSFYDKILKNWLSGDTMRCRTLVDILFILVKYLSEEELDAMFNSFQQFPPQVVGWCLSPSLSLARRGSSAGARWLRGGVARATVLGLVRRAEENSSRELLMECLRVDREGEVMVGESTVVSMLEVLSSSLEEVSGQRARVAQLAAQLVAQLGETKLIQHCETVILKIVDIALREPGSVSSCACVSRVCAYSVRVHVLRRVATWACRGLKQLDLPRIEHAASVCQYILIPDEDDLENIQEVSSLTQNLFEEDFRPQVPLEVYALRCDCIFGNINCPMENDNEFIKTIVETSDKEHTELSKKDLIVYVYKSLFRSFILKTIITRNAGVMADAYFKEQCGLIIYEYVVLKTLYDRYAFWDHYEIIHNTKNRLEGLLDDIFEKIKYEHKVSLLIYLSELAATKGYYWSYATRLYDDKVTEYIKLHPGNELTEGSDKSGVKDYKSDLSKTVLEAKCTDKLKEIMTGSGFFHSLQAESRPGDRSRCLVMVRSVSAAHAAEASALRAAGGWGRGFGIVDLYYSHNHVMLYERDLSGAPWSHIVSNAAIVDFLAEAVSDGWDMSAVEWDFTNISLCSLVTSLRLSAHRWECTKVSLLARSVLRLLCAVHSFISAIPHAAAIRPATPHVAALSAEWKDIFAPDINRNLFELLVIVLRSSNERMTSSRVATISSLIAATEHMNWDHIKTKTSDTELNNVASVAISTMERMTHHAYKYLAFSTLYLISKPLVLDDAEKLAAWSAREDERPRPEFSPALYDEALLKLQELADAALADVPGVCGSAVVWVSAGARVSVSLLLLAAALLRHAAAARTDLAHMYVELFRENKYAEWWMQTTLRLLPPDVAAFALEECDAMPERCLKYFDELPDLDVYGWCDGSTVTRLSCWVLAGALGGAGAGGARGWALAAEPRTARALQRLVPAAVAPPLVRRQLTPLAERAAELTDARVFVRRVAGEARCVLELDERELELTVRFATSHPLALPSVSTTNNSPAPDTHWVVLYLAYQNGTVLNALKMWIAAVTARVEASPQCYICYCRMHPANGRLPTVPCHQCRNKFHSVCLRKWFSTSNKSNCPLCRSKF